MLMSNELSIINYLIKQGAYIYIDDGTFYYKPIFDYIDIDLKVISDLIEQGADIHEGNDIIFLCLTSDQIIKLGIKKRNKHKLENDSNTSITINSNPIKKIKIS